MTNSEFSHIAVIGAGTMGSGIAAQIANAGLPVLLLDLPAKDASMPSPAEAAIQRLIGSEPPQLMSRDNAKLITAGTIDGDFHHLSSCDLIIEAVFENIGLKHNITKEIEPYLSDDGFWGSNTSTLPITQLAEASVKPENFIGVHFFSPVDKMPLVEIICGEKTSDEALAKAFDYTMQIRKCAASSR